MACIDEGGLHPLADLHHLTVLHGGEKLGDAHGIGYGVNRLDLGAACPLILLVLILSVALLDMT